MNWKAFGSKLSWSNFKVLSQHPPGENEKNHEKVSIAGIRAEYKVERPAINSNL
jgi:hypothetical protein